MKMEWREGDREGWRVSKMCVCVWTRARANKRRSVKRDVSEQGEGVPSRANNKSNSSGPKSSDEQDYAVEASTAIIRSNSTSWLILQILLIRLS